MSKIATDAGSGISVGRLAVPVVIGAYLIALGLVALASTQSAVVAGTLRDGDIMGVVLGIQFLAGLFLVVYRVLIGGRRSA